MFIKRNFHCPCTVTTKEDFKTKNIYLVDLVDPFGRLVSFFIKKKMNDTTKR